MPRQVILPCECFDGTITSTGLKQEVCGKRPTQRLNEHASTRIENEFWSYILAVIKPIQDVHGPATVQKSFSEHNPDSEMHCFALPCKPDSGSRIENVLPDW